MRIVTLEEHFSLPEFIKRIPKEVIAKRGWQVQKDRNRSFEPSAKMAFLLNAVFMT